MKELRSELKNELLEMLKSQDEIHVTDELLNCIENCIDRMRDDSIAIVWTIKDVHGVRPDLSDEQAYQVLQEVKASHDAEFGVNWYAIEETANNLFPKK